MKTLEEYLKDSSGIDHLIRANVTVEGNVTFYIHPHGVDGDTLDFKVEGNNLIPLR